MFLEQKRNLRDPSNVVVEETKVQINKIIFQRILLTILEPKSRSPGWGYNVTLLLSWVGFH